MYVYLQGKRVCDDAVMPPDTVPRSVVWAITAVVVARPTICRISVGFWALNIQRSEGGQTDPVAVDVRPVEKVVVIAAAADSAAAF